jgi:hypothetical protein
MGPLPGKSVETRPTRTVEAKYSRSSFLNFAIKQPVKKKQIIKRVAVILLKTAGRGLFKPSIADFNAFMFPVSF